MYEEIRDKRDLEIKPELVEQYIKLSEVASNLDIGTLDCFHDLLKDVQDPLDYNLGTIIIDLTVPLDEERKENIKLQMELVKSMEYHCLMLLMNKNKFDDKFIKRI